MLWNRRSFIKTVGAGTAALGLGGINLAAGVKSKKITILHTNDTHSHLDPFDAGHPKFANLGGVARRAALIDQIRKEESNVLLFDAGDIFQGTPYFNYYGGKLEFQMMSKMGYDAATVGNHDFDNGIKGLHKQLPHAQFDFLIANYNLKNTSLDGLLKPYKVFVKDGLKVGVFGVGIELTGLVDKSNYGEIKYQDPVGVAQDMSRILREEEKCDLVICLSHLGYEYQNDKISDVALAQQTAAIDLIIGGHTHTFLPEPRVVQNIKGEDVLINQVGWAGVNLGRIDFEFTANQDKSIAMNNTPIIIDHRI